MKEEEYKYLKELLGKINHEDVSTNTRGVYDPNIFTIFLAEAAVGVVCCKTNHCSHMKIVNSETSMKKMLNDLG